MKNNHRTRSHNDIFKIKLTYLNSRGILVQWVQEEKNIYFILGIIS